MAIDRFAAMVYILPRLASWIDRGHTFWIPFLRRSLAEVVSVVFDSLD